LILSNIGKAVEHNLNTELCGLALCTSLANDIIMIYQNMGSRLRSSKKNGPVSHVWFSLLQALPVSWPWYSPLRKVSGGEYTQLLELDTNVNFDNVGAGMYDEGAFEDLEPHPIPDVPTEESDGEDIDEGFGEDDLEAEQDVLYGDDDEDYQETAVVVPPPIKVEVKVKSNVASKLVAPPKPRSLPGSVGATKRKP